MKYYKNKTTGEVFAYEDGPLIQGLVLMTDEEVKLHLNPLPTRNDIERQRLIAYADPFSGSDRYKSEAYAERLLGNEKAAAEAEQKMLQRREEIKLQYPWPDEESV